MALRLAIMGQKMTATKTGKTRYEAVGLRGETGCHNQINEVALKNKGKKRFSF
jgi:hypothetical protein